VAKKQHHTHCFLICVVRSTIMKSLEKEKLKVKLSEKMEEFIKEATETDNNIGYVPENIETLMADAAFAVLQSVTATNQYLKDKNMLTEYYCA
jgi:hypothetical protein